MKLFISAVLSSLAFSVFAQGYVVSPDSAPVRDRSGQCVKTGSWSESDPACDTQPAKALFMSDVFFEFDQSQLTMLGKQELNKIASSINKDSSVTVTGHADQIGNTEYNYQLSMERAHAVADYLQSQVRATYHIAGLGSENPLIGIDSCRRTSVNFTQLKTCLAPDRRVEIDFVVK